MRVKKILMSPFFKNCLKFFETFGQNFTKKCLLKKNDKGKSMASFLKKKKKKNIAIDFLKVFKDPKMN